MRVVYEVCEDKRKQRIEAFRRHRKKETFLLDILYKIGMFICGAVFVIPTICTIPQIVIVIQKGWFADMWAMLLLIVLYGIVALIVWIIPMAIREIREKKYFSNLHKTQDQLIMTDKTIEYGAYDKYYNPERTYTVRTMKFENIVRIELDDNWCVLRVFGQPHIQQDWDSAERKRSINKWEVVNGDGWDFIIIPTHFKEFEQCIKQLEEKTGLKMQKCDRPFNWEGEIIS